MSSISWAKTNSFADMQGLFPKKIRILKPTFSERFQIVRANSLTQVHASGRVLTSSHRLNRTVLVSYLRSTLDGVQVKNLHLRGAMHAGW
jgi:hypothetical protein